MASIEKRGEYIYRITVSTGRATGGKKLRKRKKIEVSPKLTDRQLEKELQHQAALFEEDVRRGTFYEQSRMTLEELIEKWLLDHGKNLRILTKSGYEKILRGRVNTSLGHLRIDAIKPLHLVDFYNNLLETGIKMNKRYIATQRFHDFIKEHRYDTYSLAKKAGISQATASCILAGKPTTLANKVCDNLNISQDKYFTPANPAKKLSNQTILHHHQVLSSMFNDAVQWGLMKENPCSRVQPPRVIPKEMNSLDEDGVTRLLECLESEPIQTRTEITLALSTGCRRGEYCALQWRNIDLEKRQIHIKQSTEYTPETGITIGEPKTESSKRTISIPDSIVLLMKQYRKWQNEQKILLGEKWLQREREESALSGIPFVDPEWVFAKWDGHIAHPDSITATFGKFIKRHGLQVIRLHDLRHTAATMLINAGLNVRAVASRLGHANPNITLQVYAHALKSADRQAADMMEQLMQKNPSKSDGFKSGILE